MDGNVRQIQAGWNVYGSDDVKVGDAAEVGSNYLLVQKGWLFTKDIYIPLSAIASVQEDNIRLNVTKDQVASMGWDQMPAEDVTTYGAATTGSVTDRTMTSTTTDRDYIASTVDRDDRAATSVRATDSTISSDVADTGRAVTYDNTRDRTTDEVRIPVVEEELRVGKQAVEQGGVRVTTRVEERPVNEQVTVREEHVNVERRPANRPVSDADRAAVGQDGTVEVREHREEVVVDKQARIVEEVVINKEAHERTETVQDTVRRTDVQVEDLTGQTRTTDFVETAHTRAGDVAGTTRSTTRSDDVAARDRDEGTIERGLSKAGNAAERATGVDLDRDRDVGKRDPRNNY